MNRIYFLQKNTVEYWGLNYLHSSKHRLLHAADIVVDLSSMLTVKNATDTPGKIVRKTTLERWIKEYETFRVL